MNSVYSYYTHKDTKVNRFNVGNIQIEITEPNYDEDNKIVKPNSEIVKDPTIANTGKVPAYIRAQVYIQMAKIPYISSDGTAVNPGQEVELFTYSVNYENNSGWIKVEDADYETTYQDDDGNKYKVCTYKFVENGQEKSIPAGETISVDGQALPVFSKVKTINYMDTDQEVNAQIHICALGVQSETGTADQMWTNYKNQNGTVIVGIQ